LGDTIKSGWTHTELNYMTKLTGYKHQSHTWLGGQGHNCSVLQWLALHWTVSPEPFTAWYTVHGGYIPPIKCVMWFLQQLPTVYINCSNLLLFLIQMQSVLCKAKS